MYTKFSSSLQKVDYPSTAEKAISSLWRIDEIVLTTTDIEKLSEKIVNVMLEELGYLKLGYVIIVLSLIDSERKCLKRISISQTEHAKEALKNSPIPFQEIIFPLDDKDNLPVKALLDNQSYVTDDLSDMLYPAIGRDVVREVQRSLGIITSLVFPMYSQSTPLGTITYTLNKAGSEITDFERQILIGFTNAAGIAIDHAYLFKQLNNANDKLKELDARKNEFLSMAAHELRAPMTAIKGYLSMVMEGDTGSVSKETFEYIQNAVEGNDRLIRLVNNMLNVARIEENRMVFQSGKVSLCEVVNKVFNEFKTEASSKSLDYVISCAESQVSDVVVDQDRIYEVVANLISNSIKYTDKGKIEVVLFNPPGNSGIIRLEIRDTGRGISSEEKDKLFQKFGRIESSAGKTIGTGLGLYISKLLIEKFGGKIGVESEVGKGSTFWFELPLVK